MNMKILFSLTLSMFHPYYCPLPAFSPTLTQYYIFSAISRTARLHRKRKAIYMLEYVLGIFANNIMITQHGALDFLYVKTVFSS